MPDWVTHILDVRDGTATAKHASNFSHLAMNATEEKPPITPVPPTKHKEVGDVVVVDMKDVNVTYGTRKVNQL